MPKAKNFGNHAESLFAESSLRRSPKRLAHTRVERSLRRLIVRLSHDRREALSRSPYYHLVGSYHVQLRCCARFAFVRGYSKVEGEDGRTWIRPYCRQVLGVSDRFSFLASLSCFSRKMKGTTLSHGGEELTTALGPSESRSRRTMSTSDFCVLSL